MSMRYLTLEDLYNFYLAQGGSSFITMPEALEILKSSGMPSTATTGWYNRYYGPALWAQLNTEPTVFSALPKTTGRMSFRVLTAFATASEAIGIGETDSLPSTVYPDVAYVQPSPKSNVIDFEVPETLEYLSKYDEDVWGNIRQLANHIGVEFLKRLNQQLMHKINEAPASWKGLETLDRIVSKHGEQGVTDGNEDVYNLTRGPGSIYNAYVDDSSSLRDLTDDMIRTLYTTCRQRGGRPTMFVTGFDTYATILGMYSTFTRYVPLNEMMATITVGGIKTDAGLKAGIKIATLYDLPLIVSPDCPSTTGGISWIYCLDTSDAEGFGYPRLAINMLMPPSFFETDNYFITNKLSRKGLYAMIGETVCRFFACQGKIRDIQ